MKVLVVAPNWIGDAVMSLSLLQAVHARESSGGKACEIHVLAPPATASVYRFAPCVSQVHVEPFQHGRLQLGLRRKVARAFKNAGFELALILPNSLKSALVPWLAGIPRRHGYNGELRSLVLSRAYPKPSKTDRPPMMQWYGNLADFTAGELAFPQLRLPAGLGQSACSQFGLASGFLALAPGAEYGPAKRWPARHFAEVARTFLASQPQAQVAVLGGPKDAEFSSEIAGLLPQALRDRILILAGKTGLDEAFALLGQAGALVTNDSGLMHVAAALGVRVHAVFGSSSPHHTPPLSSSAKVYYLNLECSPCYQRQCPLGHLDCLEKLDPKKMLEALCGPGSGV